jgi:hypothetical protein
MMSNHQMKCVCGARTQSEIMAVIELRRNLRLTGQALSELLDAWEAYETIFGGQAPVEDYPFHQSLEEITCAAAGMRLNHPV